MGTTNEWLHVMILRNKGSPNLMGSLDGPLLPQTPQYASQQRKLDVLPGDHHAAHLGMIDIDGSDAASLAQRLCSTAARA